MKNIKIDMIAILMAIILLCATAGSAAQAETGTLKLPADLTRIEAEAFYGNKAITAVALPRGIQRIGAKAFRNTGITQVWLPASLTSIADDAFDPPSKVKVTCEEEGSYAYSWAVRNGYIAAPKITIQPVDAVVRTGRDVQNVWVCEPYGFSVTATGATGYQWQYSDDGGRSWYNIKGATSRVYDCIPNRASIQWPYYYRCRVAGATGAAYTDMVRVRLSYEAAIYEQPVDDVYDYIYSDTRRNYLVQYTFTALNAAAYQWQASDDEGATWTNVGERSTAPTAARFWEYIKDKPKNRRYRCQVTGVLGDVIYTDVVGFAAATSADTKPRITSQPQSVFAATGDSVTFSVSIYDPSACSCQWQVSADGESWTDLNKSTAKESTLTFTATRSDLGKYYRCRAYTSKKETCSDAVVLYGTGVSGVARITSQPQNKTITYGPNVTLNIGATGARYYQWQYRKAGSSDWTTYSTSEQSDLVVRVYKDTNEEWRCIVIGTDNIAVYSNTALLKANVPEGTPFITNQPVDYSSAPFGNYGITASFQIRAEDASTYQWQVSTDGGKTWKDDSDKTATQACFWAGDTTLEALKAKRFRCKLTGATGLVTYSNVVRVTTSSVVVIKTSCEASWEFYGDEAPMSAAIDVYSPGASIVWQRSADGGAAWKDMPTALLGDYTGTTASGAYYRDVTARAYFSGTPEAVGTICRCAVTLADGSVYYGDTVGPFVFDSSSSTLMGPMQYSQQPADQKANVGNTVTFTMKARNVYCWCWQYSTDGQTWKLVPGSEGHYNAPSEEKGVYSLSVKVTADNIDNTLYRCRLMCWGGYVFSSESVRIIGKSARITVQPTNQQVSAGETATFWVRASHASAFQWQYSDDGSTWTNLTGDAAKKDRWSASATAALIGKRRFRCVITGEDGAKVTSGAAMMIARTSGHSHSWTAIGEKCFVMDAAGYDFTTDNCCNCGFPIRHIDEQHEHSKPALITVGGIYSYSYDTHWDSEEGLCEPLHPHRANYGGVVGDGTYFKFHAPMVAHFDTLTIGYRCGCGMTKPAD